MDEKRTFPQNNKPARRDYYTAVTWAQIVICTLLGLLAFLLVKTDSPAGQRLRRDFQSMMALQIDKQQIEDVFASVRSAFMPEMTQPTTALPTEVTTTAAATSTTAAKPDATSAAVSTAAVQEGGDAEKEPTTKADTTPVMARAKQPMVRPVSGGRYSSYYGYRNNPITKEYAMHTGLDIAVPLGTSIKAAYDGTVKSVGEDGRSGKYILLSHDDGLETLYCHCSEILASQGDVVQRGTAIAKVGSTGWSTGPHLHFEVRRNGTRVDPLPLLNEIDN